MIKKVYKQKYFSLSYLKNWIQTGKILTKNLVTLRWDVFKDEKLWYFGRPLKNPTIGEGGGVQEKQLYKGDCLKRGGLGQFANLRGGGGGGGWAWQERGGGVFEGGLIP